MDDEWTPSVQMHTQHVSLARALPVLGRSAVALPCAPGTTLVPTLLFSLTSQASLPRICNTYHTAGHPLRPNAQELTKDLLIFKNPLHKDTLYQASCWAEVI